MSVSAVVAAAAASIAVILLVVVTITVLLTNRRGPNPSPTAAPPTTTPVITFTVHNLQPSRQFQLPFTSLNIPHNVAVDTVGGVYVTDGKRVLKLPAGSSTQVELPFTGLKGPGGVAVDTVSYVYVYVVDSGNNRVFELLAG